MHKIVVIEGQQSVRSNILKILQFENFHAIGAENGYVGVQLAKVLVFRCSTRAGSRISLPLSSYIDNLLLHFPFKFMAIN